jgi:hypothetical protein
MKAQPLRWSLIEQSGFVAIDYLLRLVKLTALPSRHMLDWLKLLPLGTL